MTLRIMLNRNKYSHTVRRFVTHGATPPGRIADLARIRHQAMHAPNRGALDRNGVADHSFWQGQQQSLRQERWEGLPHNIKATCDMAVTIFGTNR